MRCTSSSASETALLMLGKGSRRFSRTRAPPALPGPVPPTPRAAGRRLHCTPYDVRARWHATRAHKTTRTPPGQHIDTHWTSHTMAAAPLALDKHRGLRLRDANRPITAPQKRVELEVTPDKAPTLRGVAPAVGFYAWATPHKKQQPVLKSTSASGTPDNHKVVSRRRRGRAGSV